MKQLPGAGKWMTEVSFLQLPICGDFEVAQTFQFKMPFVSIFLDPFFVSVYFIVFNVYFVPFLPNWIALEFSPFNSSLFSVLPLFYSRISLIEDIFHQRPRCPIGLALVLCPCPSNTIKGKIFWVQTKVDVIQQIEILTTGNVDLNVFLLCWFDAVIDLRANLAFCNVIQSLLFAREVQEAQIWLEPIQPYTRLLHVLFR